MFSRLFFGFLVIFLSFNSVAQEDELMKSSNYFGVSFDIGGGLVLDENKYTSGQVTPSESPNLGATLFWEHHFYFSKHHGLIVGGGINWMTFSNSVNYEYRVNYEPQTSIFSTLGQGFRSSVFSIDLPLYYTYRFTSKIGEFSPYLGVNVRTVAGLVEETGYGGFTEDIEYEGQSYYSDYSYSFDLSRVAPMIQPTLGVSYAKNLKNGARLKYSIDYKLFLDAFSYVSTYYDHTFKMKGGYVITPNGLEPVDFISVDFTRDNLKVNMSRFTAGISYSFK